MIEPHAPGDDSVTIWIEAAKQGNDIAAQKLFERYFERLAYVSRNRVSRKRRVEDEDDAAIVSLNTLLTGLSEGRFPQVNDRTSLWPLLIDIVIKNSKQQVRREFTAKRGGGNVEGESVFINASEGHLQIADFAVDKISEQESIELADLIQHARAKLTEDDRAVFDLKLEQRSNRDVARLLGRPSRSIDRRVESVIQPLLISLLRCNHSSDGS